MATPDPDEMEQFQRLSEQYQPNLQGPLIGAKKPVSDLVREYAQADQTYIVKTTALAATHSAYRQVKGDGQCGWRGAVFGYFEVLLQSGNSDLVTQELVRLKSFEDPMRAAGIDYDIIIDLFDFTWELFEELLKAVRNGNKDENVILGYLNDENISNSIVYHFKMMTAAFMLLQSERYEPFLEMSVQQYRLTRIDPSNQEIDHIGLQALTDAIISPAAIGLEVSYLDRSTGDEVTPHEFVPDAQGWPTIRMIYRPGHYDLIYKLEQAPLQVFLQPHSIQYQPSFQNSTFRGNFEDLQLQSFIFPNADVLSPPGPFGSPTGASGYESHIQPQQQMLFQDTTSSHPGYIASHYSSISSAEPSEVSVPLPGRSYSSPVIHPRPQLSPSPPSPESPPPNLSCSKSTLSVKECKEPQIRYNQYFHSYSRQRHEIIPLDRESSSASSNQAHFTNLDFQPQMWNAEEEYSRQ